MNKKIGIGMGVLASLALAGGMAFAQGGNPPASENRAGGAANAPNTARAGRIINGVVSAINGQTLVLGGQGGNRNAAELPSSENTDVAFYAPMDAGVTARRAGSAAAGLGGHGHSASGARIFGGRGERPERHRL